MDLGAGACERAQSAECPTASIAGIAMMGSTNRQAPGAAGAASPTRVESSGCPSRAAIFLVRPSILHLSTNVGTSLTIQYLQRGPYPASFAMHAYRSSSSPDPPPDDRRRLSS